MKENKDLIDLLIRLNRKKPTPSLREIGEDPRVMLTANYVHRLIKDDPRYVPGKKGFARIPRDKMKKIASRGGKASGKLGYGYRKKK